MLVDEFFYHRRREIPRWERLGHPLDTVTVLVCLLCALNLPNTRASLIVYTLASVFSCLFITKDEWVHARLCGAGESWLHAMLFLFHPILLILVGVWKFSDHLDPSHPFFGSFLVGQSRLVAIFFCYQILYWNGPWKPKLNINY